MLPLVCRYSNHLIASLHRTPENYYTDQQCMHDFVATFKRFVGSVG